jgi:hypothetical protein
MEHIHIYNTTNYENNSDDTVVIHDDYAIGEVNRDIIGGAISIPACTWFFYLV